MCPLHPQVVSLQALVFRLVCIVSDDAALPAAANHANHAPVSQDLKFRPDPRDLQERVLCAWSAYAVPQLFASWEEGCFPTLKTIREDPMVAFRAYCIPGRHCPWSSANCHFDCCHFCLYPMVASSPLSAPVDVRACLPLEKKSTYR